MVQYFPVITGSLTVNGNLSVTGTTTVSASNSVSSSYAYTASSAVSSSYAYTASSAVNSFSASKAISSSYADTASFSNDFTVLGNLTVYGTQSIQYITSSQLNVSDNVITVNVASPGVRFGGLSVFDSGSISSEATASLFWDSQNNHWIYQRESGSSYTGGMLISGPRNAAGLGNEQGTTSCMLLVGQGGDHLTSSMIYHDSTCTNFYSNVLSVSANGNVGIGIGTPSSRLQIQGASGCDAFGTFLGGAGSTLAGIKIGNDTTVYGSLYFDNATNDVLLLQQYAAGNLRLGTNSAERMRITNSGITSFTCQTCAPQFITSQGSSVSYEDGACFISWNSESECISLSPNTCSWVPMKYWIADKTGTARAKFTAYIQSGPNYWAFRFTKNGSCLYQGHYNNSLDCGQVSSVHEYRTFTAPLTGLNPGDCITFEMGSANSGGSLVAGSGTQCVYVKELRMFGRTPNFSQGGNNSVFGQWVGIGTSCPFSNLHVQGNNEAAYDASVDNGQDGCGVTLTIRNNNTTTNSFAQLNMQVSGDSGRAIGRIALIRRDSATSDMAFVTEDGNTKTEKMRITGRGNVLIGMTSGVSGRVTCVGLQVQNEVYSRGTSSGFFWEDRSYSAWGGWYTNTGCTYMYNGSGNAASINMSSGAYTPLSDVNKKKDFEISTIGLNEILQLKPTLYRFKDAEENSQKELGFIAQEVKNYIPQAYVESDGGIGSKFIGLNDRAILAATVKAIQEQQCIICSQASMINTLKTCIGIA
jgi:hypothetical protein